VTDTRRAFPASHGAIDCIPHHEAALSKITVTGSDDRNAPRGCFCKPEGDLTKLELTFIRTIIPTLPISGSPPRPFHGRHLGRSSGGWNFSKSTVNR